MLQLKLFTVYDVKAETHFPPFAVGNVAEALRSFTDLLEDPQSKLSRHPEDYRLFSVGGFEVTSGVVRPNHDGPQLIEAGLSLVQKEA